MHARELDVLQEARDQHRLTVGDRVDVDLDPLKEAIDAQRATAADLADAIELALKVRERIGEIDREATDHIRRPHDHRVADALHQVDRLLATACQAALGLQDSETIEECGEAHAILGLVDGLKRGAEEWHARCGEWCREIERRLSAELHEGRERRLPLGRFGTHDLHDGLGVERLKVEAR